MAKLEASVITTYRCMNRCFMCHIWQHPTTEQEEFHPSLLEKLPDLAFCNITGGEPFLRDDLEDIIRILQKKAGRLVISTNGYKQDQIISLAKKFPRIGIRISLEGLAAANDELRGIPGGFERGKNTILELKKLGLKDIGFAVTLSDRNYRDMLELYRLADSLQVEFATAAVHNSFYFHKHDNAIQNQAEVVQAIRILIRKLLRTGKVKNWYRAYFNYGLINYIRGKPRLLPCRAGTDMFFLDPGGEILPCNGMEEKVWFGSMGNLHTASFSEIWNSQQAGNIREKVKTCPKNCWMIGTAGPAIKKNPLSPSLWVASHKLRSICRRENASKTPPPGSNK